MKNITIILPIHNIDENYKKMIKTALESVEEFHNDVIVSIVCPPKIKKQLINLSQKLEIKFVENKGNEDFCSQVNRGIESCDTEWFSILEVDDEYTKKWLKFINEYITKYPEIDVFLPLVKDIDTEGRFLSFTNESAWAYGFTENQGFIDNEVLVDYQNYQTSGGVYRTKVIKDIGMFKDNIKLTFGYEFLLRLTHNVGKIMVIPRIGYKHTNFREDSIFWKYKNDENMKMSQKEVKFWLETAKKEYFFKNKRDVEYISQ
jgi:glycosyltransferase involved in cell wall biosynthesis